MKNYRYSHRIKCQMSQVLEEETLLCSLFCCTELITVNSRLEMQDTWPILETRFLLHCKTAKRFKQPMLANYNCRPNGGLILVSSCLWHICVTGLENSAKALFCLMKRCSVWFRVALLQDRDFWQEDFNQNNCPVIKSLIMFLCNDIYKKVKKNHANLLK